LIASPAGLKGSNDLMIRDKGRMAWQKAVGYRRRSLGEAAMFRYKAIIGRCLRARTLSVQRTEAKIVCSVLNQMTRPGIPVSQRIASDYGTRPLPDARKPSMTAR